MEFKNYNHALIDTVRNSPYLYDPSDKHYKKGRSRVELWEEVSKKLQGMGYRTTGEKCRERWNCLKGRFVRERNTMKKLKSNYIPRFSFYSAMKFVEPFLTDTLQRQSYDYNSMDFQPALKYEAGTNSSVEESFDKQIHRLLVQNNVTTNDGIVDMNEFTDSAKDSLNEIAMNSVTVHALRKMPLVGTDCAQIYPLTDSSFSCDPFVVDLVKTKSWIDKDQISSIKVMSWQWYHDELLKIVNFFEVPFYMLGSTYDKNAKIIPSCCFLTMLIETNLYLYTNLPIVLDDIVHRMLIALYSGLFDEENGEPYFLNFTWPLELERKTYNWDEAVEIIVSRYSSSVPQSISGIINTVMISLKLDSNQEEVRNLIEQLIMDDLKESLVFNLRLLLCGFQLLTFKASTFCNRIHEILNEALDGAISPFIKWQQDQFRLSCVQLNLELFKATVAFTTYHFAHIQGRCNTVIQKTFLRSFLFHNIPCYHLIYEAQEVSSTPIYEFSRYFFVGILKRQLEILCTALNLYQDNGFRIADSRFHGFNFPEHATALYFPICQLLSPQFCFCLTQKMMPELYAVLYGFINRTALNDSTVDGMTDLEQQRWMGEGYEVRKLIERQKTDSVKN
ncbi:unnamed protein product [Thelazia callipaeda]|uniref:MADF domain-containing protein n=1 Tax=Thelazia callipaeda TaxID=103827 RepID=A0A0N5CZV0_THECL|nr:unnamed protein product [Thelazia callipaeda]